MALVANGNFEESAQLANLAAGIVVGKVGTATVTTEEIFSLL
jgi:D-beta-D-heptose 7-phosphate kinase/D-beta-D-heptose 1-phosphate adenosyltransferase